MGQGPACSRPQECRRCGAGQQAGPDRLGRPTAGREVRRKGIAFGGVGVGRSAHDALIGFSCLRVDERRWPDSRTAFWNPDLKNGARRREFYEDRDARSSILARSMAAKPDTLKQTDDLAHSIKPLADGAGHTFLKVIFSLAKKTPDRAIANMDITRGKLAPYVIQRQIWRRGDKGEQPIPLILETRMALPAHRLGSDAPGLPKPLRPPNNAAHGDAELLCRRAATCSRPDSGYNARAKVFRIGLRHPCWPPAPASILNHSEACLGIPCDSLTVDSALASIEPQRANVSLATP